MNKEDFLKKLQSSLGKLEPEDLKKVMSKYKRMFTNKQKKGKSEAEIIDELGNYNELVKKILAEHNVDTPVVESATTINAFFKEFLDVIESIVKYLSNNGVRNNVKLILQLVVLLVIISFLRLPIIFIRDIVCNVLAYLFSPLNTVIIFCFRFICEVSYLIIALAIFIKTYNIVIKESIKK